MKISDSPEGSGARVVALRAVTDADSDFLRRVYASTREDEMAIVPWSSAEKERFLDQQFSAQNQAYRNNYPGAEFLIIQIDGKDGGRLYIHRRQSEIRIMDLALLPEFRRLGVGTRLLQAVMAEGARTGRFVSIHVEAFNPALRLYERLGFREAGRTHVYLLMEWKPSAPVEGVGTSGAD